MIAPRTHNVGQLAVPPTSCTSDVRTLATSALAARAAAGIVLEAASMHPTMVLGVATGGTPEALYRELARAVERGEADLSGLTLVALDEYVGLSPAHPQSYARYVRERISAPLGIPEARVHVPSGAAASPTRAAAEYDELVGRLGVQLQILGIGNNGHIGFNEPGSAFDSRTRVVALTPATRQSNARFFADISEVPTHAVTQGIGTILDAESLLLLATGEGKQEALARAMSGPVSRDCPASALQLHGHVTVVADAAAAPAVRP